MLCGKNFLGGFMSRFYFLAFFSFMTAIISVTITEIIARYQKKPFDLRVVMVVTIILTSFLIIALFGDKKSSKEDQPNNDISHIYEKSPKKIDESIFISI